MKKVNQDYWQRRAVRYESDWNKLCAETVEKRLARHYEKALAAIKDDILQLYAAFAKDNRLDFNEARRALSSREFREWRMSMREYIEANDAGLTRELNTLAMQPRISRLEKLYGETLQELDKLGRNVNGETRNFLTGAYKDNYSRDIFDLVKVGGLSVALAHVDSPSVEKVLAARWSGKNYSQRIWTNTRLLSRAVREIVATGVHRGLSIPQLAQKIEDKMHGGYNNAVRLVRTEMSFVNNQAHADSMEAAGIVWYEFIATLDNRTSVPCRNRDGETYPLEEKTVGFNYPPLHPRCRSTVAPFIDGVSKSGTRNAKVGKDTIRIPASMSYRDYETVYVKKEKTLEQWQSDSKPKAKNISNSKNLLQNPSQNIIINNNQTTSTLTGAINCRNFDELRNYWKINYGVKVFDSMIDIDFQVFREISHGIESVIKEFPKVRKTLQGLDTEGLYESDTYIQAIYEGYINFNKDCLNPYSDLQKKVAEDVKYHYHPRNMGIAGLGSHEMGHILERALIDKYGGGIPEWENETYTEKLVREAVAIVQATPEGKTTIIDHRGRSSIRKVSINQLRRRISDYAGQKDMFSETLAEAVCDYITNGENANTLSKEIWKILKRELD